MSTIIIIIVENRRVALENVHFEYNIENGKCQNRRALILKIVIIIIIIVIIASSVTGDAEIRDDRKSDEIWNADPGVAQLVPGLVGSLPSQNRQMARVSRKLLLLFLLFFTNRLAGCVLTSYRWRTESEKDFNDVVIVTRDLYV